MLYLLIFLFTNLSNSLETFRVFYTDKDTISFENQEEIYQKTLELYTEDALKRRAKNQSILTIEDAIVTPTYIEEIQKYDIEYVNSSRWFNYSLVRTTPEVVEELKKLEFIKKIEPTQTRFTTHSIDNYKQIDYTSMILEENRYGSSDKQNEQLQIDKLHKLGFNGDSVIIGYLDSGFKLDPRAVDSNHLKEQYDFINGDGETSNSEGESPIQDLHGTSVMSVVSAYHQDSLIGLASESMFYLAKTENIPDEKNTEEDFYLFGVEWLEARGAEIVNSSLGYRGFDDGEYSYTFTELDGNTTLSSQAVNKAVARNIMFFTSMGNTGSKESSLISPADADSVIAIGGLQKGKYDIAGFSSRGPNAKNAVRPHFVAQGTSVDVVSNNPEKLFTKSNGTSFASPLMAGATAVVKSAFPDLSNKQILVTMQGNAFNPSGENRPSNTFGYGVVNYEFVMGSFSTNFGPPIAPYNTFEIDGKLRVVLYIFSNRECDVKIRYLQNGTEIEKTMAKGDVEHQYFFDLEEYLFNDGYIDVKFSATNIHGITRNYRDDYIRLYWGKEIIRKGVDKFQMPTFVDDFKEDIRPILYSDRLEIINNSEKYFDCEINILDINGKFLFLNSILLQQKINVLEFENKLNYGLYFVVLKSRNGIKTYKLILK